MKKIVIITGGACDTDGIDRSLYKDAYVIAADSGYDTALKLGISPNLLVGDMDSIHEVPCNIETLKVKSEKDDTDTMLGISIAREMGAEEIVIIGGGGGRADHWLSNIFMLEKLSDDGIKAEIHDGVNRIFVLCDGSAVLSNTGGYFGLLAIEDSIVSACGCKYPLQSAVLTRTHPYAVSNEITENEACITVHGKIFVTVSKR